MARGRKPKANAIRRGGIRPAETVEIVPADEPVMPARVAASPEMAAKWELCTAGTARLLPEDAPLLESWCFWAVVADQCARDLDDDPDPDLIRKAEKASTMLMRLGDALHLSPTARQRAGLVEAMTASTQVGIAERTRAEFRGLNAAQ